MQPKASGTARASADPSRTARDPDLSRLIHDLRSPLTALQLGLETLGDMVEETEAQQVLAQLLGEVARLSARLEAATPPRRAAT